MRALKFAPWGMAAVLWPPIAVMGGLGFAPLALLMTLFLAFHDKQIALQLYALALMAALAFAALSASWSPYQSPLIEFDVENGKYAIKASMVRVSLTALLCSIVIAAALRVPPERARVVFNWFLVAFALQGLFLVAETLFPDQLYAIFKNAMSSKDEGIQNVARNGLIFSMVSGLIIVALLQGWLGAKGVVRYIVLAAFLPVATYFLWLSNAVAGVLVLAVSTISMIAFSYGGVLAWRVLGVVTGLYVIAAPLVFSTLISVIGEHKSSLTASAWWRIETWTFVLQDIISQKPWLGWGLDSLRTFQNVFDSGRWEGLPVVPNHAHNMFLHIWAETGFVGALCVGLICVLLGWRLSNVQSMSIVGRRAAASLWGGALVVCSFSFSLWNEWWWALIGLLAALIVLMERASQRAG